MAEIKLFRTSGDDVHLLPGTNVALERDLQALMERHLETFLGVRFLASEFPTSNGGRIDTLGIDENGSPTIIEYKRSRNDNVINQGLFYVDWLMDHKAEFTMLAMERLGNDIKESIDWSGPRLICIAGDFNKYDSYAIQQMARNIDLVRYYRYGDELLLLELITGTTVKSPSPAKSSIDDTGAKSVKTVTEYLSDADPALTNLYSDLEARLLGLGDDAQKKVTLHYIAFKRLKNFASVEVKAASSRLVLYLKVDPKSIALEEGFSRDVTSIGHLGTGDLELTIRSTSDLNKAQPLIEASYELA